MFEGFSLREGENYDCKEEKNTLVKKTIFIFSAEGKTPEFLWLTYYMSERGSQRKCFTASLNPKVSLSVFYSVEQPFCLLFFG